MENNEEKTATVQAGENLFTFAVDRQDVKEFMALLPENSDIKKPAVEYELQLLKIIMVGWAVSFYAVDGPEKNEILETYWQSVREFSWSLSEASGLMIGKDIDYFQTVKDRLNTYVAAMEKTPEAPEPAVIIGPEFAKACGHPDETFTTMTGSRMCVATLQAVREYVQAIDMLQN